jgi:autotransporter-associated beta strand protein
MTFARLRLLAASALLVVLLPVSLKADELLLDHFDYLTGNTLSNYGWQLIPNSGGAATPVVTNNLSYAGFAQSSGNAVQLRPNGQDWYKTFNTQTYTTNDTASLYYSFLMRVDNLGLLSTTGDYFAGFGGTNGLSLGATVAIRAADGGFQLGVGKRDSTAIGSYSWGDTVFSLGSAVLVVGSYNFVGGLINNDTASLWLNPLDASFGQSNAPTATLTTALSGINNDVLSFSSFTLKPQGNATSTQIPASLIFDELRVGNTWADVTPYLLSVWAGGGTNSNWGTAANWQNGLVPTNGAPLLFSGSSGVTSSNNLTGFSTTSITFATNAASFSVVGNAVTLNGNIANESTNAQAIALNLTIAAETAVSSGSNILTIAGAVGGSGGLTKTGAGTLVLSGDNSFTGALSVQAGTLDLAAVGGSAAGGAASVLVAEGATLLLSRGGQVDSGAAVTLSGGTIMRAGGVSEVFGNLTLAAASFIDFSAGDGGVVSFGTYAPSSLLTVRNFFEGNTLTFGSDLRTSINDAALFSFDNSFTSDWDSGSGTFTITAIPEPGTCLVALGLLGVFLWPMRRHLAFRPRTTPG